MPLDSMTVQYWQIIFPHMQYAINIFPHIQQAIYVHNILHFNSRFVLWMEA